MPTHPQTVYRVSEIRDNVLRRVHGYYASLPGAFAYCETEERKKPLIDSVRFGLFLAPGGSQWLIHCFYGPEDHAPEVSDFVISRHEVVADETAVPSAPATQAADVDRRDRYAAAIDEGFRLHAELEDVSLGESITSSVLAVVDAEQTELRAALLREVADECDTAGAAYTARAQNEHAAAAFTLMETFLRKANETEYVATPCDFVACEPGGEPCDTHERLMAHGEGDHELCGPDCGTPLRRLADEEQQPETETPVEPEPDDPEKTVRDHVLALHQIGEQLAGIESWFWEHLAYVRATAVAPAAVPAAVEEQPETETEADQPRHRWSVETRDAVADQWTPGTPITDHDKAVERYEHATRNWPTWKDGTPVQRRLVRATTTYTVEAEQQPAVVAGEEQPTTCHDAAVAQPGKEA